MLYKAKDQNKIIYEFALAKDPQATLIWLWGFPSYPKESVLSKYLNKQKVTICFPHYFGSWLSAGKFSPENCQKTVNQAHNIIKKGSTRELYSNQEISWPTDNIIIAGGSFGGFWALQASEQLDLDKYLLLAPFIDIKNQNIDNDEEDIDKTLSFSRRAMSQAYRGIEDRAWNEFFKEGQIDLDQIRNKEILIVHGKKDQSIKIDHSREAREKLKENNSVELFETSCDHGIHKQEDKELFRKIEDFILS